MKLKNSNRVWDFQLIKNKHLQYSDHKFANDCKNCEIY